MRRRQFISLAGGAVVAWPFEVWAQQTKRLPIVALVGVAPTPVADISGSDPVRPWARAFVHGLRDLGWIDGRTVIIEPRITEPKAAPDILREMVERSADVIVVGGARWLHDAARAATPAIPIVTLFQDDPVKGGLIASMSRPGGNLTGVAQTTGPEFFAKRLQLLLEIAPNASRVALVGPRGVLEQFRPVALPAGISVAPIELEVAEQFDAAFAAILDGKSDALMVSGSALTYNAGNIKRVVAFAAGNRLPAIHGYREAVDAGGLLSYGTSIPGIYGQMAIMVARFLGGAKAGDVPAETPTRFELVVNLKTAKTLGLSVSPAFLARADEVIE